MQGYVRNVEIRKPFGFIRVEGSDDHFFHAQDCEDFALIKERFYYNERVVVEFDSLRNGNKGMRAQNVRIVNG